MSDVQRPSEAQPTDNLDGYAARTIPVHVPLDAEQHVLILEEAQRILQGANSVALGPCTCRQTEKRCDAPVDVCLSLNTEPSELMEGFRPVTVDEALDALRRSHDAGLVHLAYRKDGGEIQEFCSCCSCCCWFLTRMKASGNTRELHASPFVAQIDKEACVGCGTCVQRCPFDAWSQAEAGRPPVFDPNACFGCGVCVSACPAGALTLQGRTPRP